ncbi:MAG: hypothetical protein ACJ73D_04350, partial [Pyrinomonadaceae bacterium]
MNVLTRATLSLLVAVLSALQFGSLGSESSSTAAPQSGALSFQIDPASSTFMVRAHRGGPAWFKGHDHFIAVREFKGGVSITANIVSPASLGITIQANSLEETGANFSPQQKAIIKKELDEIVLEV